MNTNLVSMLTRDRSDLIVGIDYDKGEVWLYGGEIIGASEWSQKVSFYYQQGMMLGAMI